MSLAGWRKPDFGACRRMGVEAVRPVPHESKPAHRCDLTMPEMFRFTASGFTASGTPSE